VGDQFPVNWLEQAGRVGGQIIKEVRGNLGRGVRKEAV